MARPAILPAMTTVANDAETLCWEIRRSFRALSAAAEGELGVLGIHAGDRALLEFLAREDEPITLSALARKTAVSRQHIHQALRRLPDPGWVEQIADADDRRTVRLRLSRSGKAFWRRVRAVDRQFFARLAPALPGRDTTSAIALLQKLRQALASFEEHDDGQHRSSTR
jgi:DNA-binding MarR family transcriptional regulator